MFPFGRRAREARRRAADDASILLASERDPYTAARARERAAADDDQAGHWRRVALAVAKRTGRRVGLDVATRMLDATGAPGRRRSRPPLLEVDMLHAYNLEFLAPTGDGLSVKEEREIRAPNAGAAIDEALRADWPPRATLVRLTDLDGTVLLERGRD